MLYLSVFFFSLSFLWPYHFLPLPLFYQNSFIFLSILCLLNSFKKLKIDQFSILLLILIFIIIILEYFINKNFSEVFLYFLITYLFILISYILGYNFREKNENLKIFINFFIITCFLLFIIQIIQFYQISSPYIKEISPLNSRIYSNIGQPNILSTIYATAIFILMQKSKKLNYIAIIIFVFGIYLTKSRIGYLSLCCISILNIIKIKPIKLSKTFKSLYPSIILIIIFLINSKNKVSFTSKNRLENFSNGRIEIYKDAINLIKDNYLLGYGWESAYKYVPSNNTIFFKSPLYSYHNIIIDLVLSYGLIIATAIILLIFLVFFKNIKDHLIIYFTFFPFIIHSMVEFPYYYWYLLMPFSFILGYTNKNFINKEKAVLNKNLILLFILISISIYYLFHMEHDDISQPYLSAYYGNCLPPSKDNFIFFSNAEKFIKYHCTSKNNIDIRENIILESLHPNLIVYYLNSVKTPNQNIKKYGCIKYNYYCNKNPNINQK